MRPAPLILLLSLSLALAGPPAMAQITLSGQAAMGLDLGPSGRVTAGHRGQLDLRASSVTDGGVEFGMEFRLRGGNTGADCRRGGGFASAQGAHRGCRSGAGVLFLEIGGN